MPPLLYNQTMYIKVHLYRTKYQAQQQGKISISFNSDWAEPYDDSKENIEAAEVIQQPLRMNEWMNEMVKYVNIYISLNLFISIYISLLYLLCLFYRDVGYLGWVGLQIQYSLEIIRK